MKPNNPHSERAHAKLAPSASGRWLSCTASPAFIEQHDYPYRTNPAAEEGTIAHQHCEDLLLGTTPDPNISKEMHEFCQGYVNYALKIAGENKYIVEAKLPLFYSPKEHCTVDFCTVVGTHLHIVDFKYGKFKVQAKDNTQLLIYAQSWLHNYPNHDPNITHISLHIYQPRVENIHHHTYTRYEFNTEVYKIANTVDNIKMEMVEFKPAEKTCFFCPAAPEDCAAHAEWQSKGAGIDFHNLDAPLDLPPPTQVSNQLTRGELIKVIRHAPTYNRWVKEARHHLLEDMIVNSNHHPRTKLTKGRAKNVWDPNSLDETKELLSNFGVKLLEEKPLTPAKVIAILQAAGKLTPGLELRLQTLIKTTHPKKGLKLI